ncbi:hypothetical protein Y1Q_0020925 [Alligator mississippiensis]|uniref:Uncharacterized protein n=1 Tax=Alligator mississippiensis TaxID=8496 RepID=A0A151NJE0_ALLMI|nr:hypothetical protein Y1Q_0020925 [Alligator mississippiensis]
MHLTVRTGANRREHWKPGVAFIPGGRQCVALKRGNPSDMDMGNIESRDFRLVQQKVKVIHLYEENGKYCKKVKPYTSTEAATIYPHTLKIQDENIF